MTSNEKDIDKEALIPKVPEMSMEDFRDYLREATDYIHKRNEVFNDIIKQKTKKAKAFLKYPFIIEDSDLLEIDSVVRGRIKEIPDVIPDQHFLAKVTFKNLDTFEYSNMSDLLGNLVESKIVSLTLLWRYIVPVFYDDKSMFDDGIVFVPFDIIISYDSEQDDDYKENHMLDECQKCLIEGLNYDWIGETLKQIKTSIKKTRMPFWYYWLKLGIVKIRPFLNLYILAVLVTLFGLIFTVRGTRNVNNAFNNLFHNSDSIDKKINVIFDYLTRPTDLSFILYYALGIGVSGVLYGLLLIFYRYLTPPSMFIIGANKKRLKNILVLYNYIYGTIIIAGIVVPLLVSNLT